jgi:protein SCO1/2
MNGNKLIPRSVLLVVALAAALVMLGILVTQQASKSRSNLPRYGEVTDFSFARSDGGSFTKQDFQGKISVVDFIFTSCRGVCPAMAGNMSELYRLFAGVAEIQFVSISVDPENDTPEVLSAYARENGVTDQRWLFLRGPIADVSTLCERGFLLPGKDFPSGHSSRFVLVDRQGWIRGYYDGTGDMQLLTEHLRQLAKAKS